MPEMSISDAFQLALQHHQADRWAEAEPIYRKILEVDPNHADSLHLLGMIAFQTKHPEPALELVQRAIALRPDAQFYHNNCGQILEQLGHLEQAGAEYRRAIELDPSYPEPRNNLGNILERKGHLNEAIACYEMAFRLNPRYAEAHTNLGNLLKDQGKLEEAVAHYRQAVELNPNFSVLHSNLLLGLHYCADVSPAALAAAHRQWRERHGDPLKATHHPHSNRPDPDRRIRVGYVSPDFREHPVGRMMLPLLANHNRSAFEVFAYADISRADDITAQVRANVDVWRDVTKRSDDQLAALVREDQIDILVDLTAHTAHTRLLAFARKPAPVQVTYLAYCSTTGLDTIDYRISDPYFDPPGTDLRDYSEKTILLPETYWCYSSPERTPDVNALPALHSGSVTFGCLNNFCKVTDASLGLWSTLLNAIPNAILLLHAREGDHRQRVTDFLRAHGVAGNRVQFAGKQPQADYFATYLRIDIGLDPYPFTGGTTTCDALWMGVPVVTLKGHTAVSRGGTSLLSNLGLPELVAETEADYVRIAKSLAEDRPRLAQLRATLRGRLQASAVMDAPRFAKNMEAAYRQMWRAWCDAPRL